MRKVSTITATAFVGLAIGMTTAWAQSPQSEPTDPAALPLSAEQLDLLRAGTSTRPLSDFLSPEDLVLADRLEGTLKLLLAASLQADGQRLDVTQFELPGRVPYGSVFMLRGGAPLVDITVVGDAERVADRLRGMAGVTVTGVASTPAYSLISAVVPTDHLLPVASEAGVKAVYPSGAMNASGFLADSDDQARLRELQGSMDPDEFAGLYLASPAERPIEGEQGPDRNAESSFAPRSQGIANNQAEQALEVDQARAVYGALADGSGIDVGTLSDSVNQRNGFFDNNCIFSTDCVGVSESQAVGDLPPGGRVNIVDDTASGSDEGRAMMEHIFDIAPQTGVLAFATAFNGEASFASNICCGAGSLFANNMDIINDDVIYFGEPYYQDGVVAQAVVNYVNAGGIYFALNHNYGSLFYEAVFNPGGASANLHDYAAGDETQNVTVLNNSSILIGLQWSQPWGGATTDLDIEIWNSTITTKLWDSDTNNIGGNPNDFVTITNNTGSTQVYHIAIRQVSGSVAGLTFKYVAFNNGICCITFDQYPTATGGSLTPHAGTALSIAIGAAPFFDRDNAEGFSGRGPHRRFFTAGGAASAANYTKPDFLSVDKCNTTFFGGDIAQDADTLPNFSGTSAATPNAAAVAALMLDAAGGPGNLNQQNVRDIMRITAIDLGSAGHDTTFGYGRINALGAVAGARGPESAEFTIYPNQFGDGSSDQNLFSVTDTDRFEYSFNNGGDDTLVAVTTDHAVMDPMVLAFKQGTGELLAAGYQFCFFGCSPEPVLVHPTSAWTLYTAKALSENAFTGPANITTLVLGPDQSVDATALEPISPTTWSSSTSAAINVNADLDFFQVTIPNNIPWPAARMMVSSDPDTSLDGIVLVYDDAGAELGRGDGFAAGDPDEVQVTGLAPGQVVVICVSSWSYASNGNFDLSVQLAADNDHCEDAVTISVPSTTLGRTTTATLDPEALDCGTSVSAPGVWYQLLGTGHTMSATTCNPGTDYDTKLNVYCGSCGDGLDCVAGNDDQLGDLDPACDVLGMGFNRASTVSWCSELGALYFILVQGFGGETGDFEMDVFDDGAPCSGANACGGVAIGACCAPNECPAGQDCTVSGFLPACDGLFDCFCTESDVGEPVCVVNDSCGASTPCPNGISDCPTGQVCAESCCGILSCWDPCEEALYRGQADLMIEGDPDARTGSGLPLSSARGVTGQCVETDQFTCENSYRGVYHGDGVACDSDPCCEAPPTAGDPDPAHNATGMPTDTDLTWDGGIGGRAMITFNDIALGSNPGTTSYNSLGVDFDPNAVVWSSDLVGATSPIHFLSSPNFFAPVVIDFVLPGTDIPGDTNHVSIQNVTNSEILARAYDGPGGTGAVLASASVPFGDYSGVGAGESGDGLVEFNVPGITSVVVTTASQYGFDDLRFNIPGPAATPMSAPAGSGMLAKAPFEAIGNGAAQARTRNGLLPGQTAAVAPQVLPQVRTAIPDGYHVEAGALVRGELDNGKPLDSPIPAAPRGVASNTTVIDFDDVTAPCFFQDTVRLTSEYAHLGVLFEGPGGSDGGAILDECGNFGVTGQSSPNFLAFNVGLSLSDGGVPRGPETIYFFPPVSRVQALVGVGSGQNAGETVTFVAYNGSGSVLDQDSATIASALTRLVVSSPGITRVVVESTAGVFVLDDLTFERCPTTYDVLFGTSNPPVSLICSDTQARWCDPGPLLAGTTYYWRVVAENCCGSSPGPIWSFTTGGGSCSECGPGPHWMHDPPCPAGVDFIPNSQALVGIDLIGDCEMDTTLRLVGPVTVQRQAASDDSANFPGLANVDGHRDVIDTEIVNMVLTASGFTLTAGAGMGNGGVLPPTLGAIKEQPGDPNLGDSFFDVMFEVELDDGTLLYNHTPLRIESTVDCLPPNTSYIHPRTCLELFDQPTAGGAVVARLVTANHRTFATGACCLSDGSCVDNVTAIECEEDLGGHYEGDETECEGRVCTVPCEDCGPGPHWIHNPPCPAGVDTISNSQALVGIDTDFDCEMDTTLRLTGPVNVQRQNPSDVSANFPGMFSVDGHIDVIDTEIISMQLTRGGVTLTAGAGSGLNPSLGAIHEQGGDPALADSFFDVFFKVDLGDGVELFNHEPLRIASVIDCIPPDTTYIHPNTCLVLYDSQTGGIPIAQLVTANHNAFPIGACCVDNGTCVGGVTQQECEDLIHGHYQGDDTQCSDDLCVEPCEVCGPGDHWIDPCQGGSDHIPSSQALVGIDITGNCEMDTTLRMVGAVDINRSASLDDSVHFPNLSTVDGHFDVIDTEIVSMVLTKNGVTLTAGGGLGQGGVLRRSLGAIKEKTGNSALADSFFDVFFEVRLGDGTLLYNHSPLRIESVIDCIPPDANYIHPFTCLPLFDAPPGETAVQIGNLVTGDHNTFAIGACCLDNGTCAAGVSRVECEFNLQGRYRGDGTECVDADCRFCACGDLDRNGIVNLNDLATFVRCFDLPGPGGSCSPDDYYCSDLNGDNAIDLNDFLPFVQSFDSVATSSPPDCGNGEPQ